MAFHNGHKSFHHSAIADLKKMITKENICTWYHDFFGYHPDNYTMYIGLLNGSCNYGYRLTLPNEQEIFVSILGARRPDKSGAPTYPKEWFLPVIIHEYCHSYINPLTISHPEVFQETGEALLDSQREKMVEHGYNRWNVVLNEYMVHACKICFLAHVEGMRSSRKMIEYDKEWGFPAIEGVVKLLEEYENNRAEYAHIVSFLPNIKRYFESYLAEL